MSNQVENGNVDVGLGDTLKWFNLEKLPHIVKVLDRRQKTYPDVMDVIGNTPLVKLQTIPKEEGIECDMYAKCEYLNPGGSVKDRIGWRMVFDAEQKGILRKGHSVIIEPTSGNTGIGLALAAAVKGYRCIIVLPEKMSDEKVNTLAALGAEIIRTPTEVASDDPQSNIMVARRLELEIPGGVVLDQYNNPCNPLAHYDGTAEEILWGLDEDVDMVVIGAGTSGTISGVAHKVKERCPNCRVVGVDPYGSLLAVPQEKNDTDITYYEVEGIGYDFLPRVLDRSSIDEWIKTKDIDSFNMARRVIAKEGLLCGGSSGAAIWAAMRAAKTLKKGQKCVVILPDSIRNYMTKFISDNWMEARHFKPIPESELAWWNVKVTAEISQKMPTITKKTSPSEAFDLLRRERAQVLAVVDEKGSLLGTFTADYARRRIANLNGSATKDTLDKFIVKKYYKVDLQEGSPLGLVSRILDIAPYVVLVNTDQHTKIVHPVGLVTSEDLMYHVSKSHQNGN